MRAKSAVRRCATLLPLLALVFSAPASAQPSISGINWTVKKPFPAVQERRRFQVCGAISRPGRHPCRRDGACRRHQRHWLGRAERDRGPISVVHRRREAVHAQIFGR